MPGTGDDSELPATELHDGAMNAGTDAAIFGQFRSPQQLVTLDDFIRELATDWRGWDELRRWRSLEDGLELDASHNHRGHVHLGITLRAPGHSIEDIRWSARAVFDIEAGEQMTNLAADLAHPLDPET